MIAEPSARARPRRATARALTAGFVFLLWMALAAPLAQGANVLNWSTNQNRVTADIRSQTLLQTLKQVAAATGWKVFLEPDVRHGVSAKFENLPPGDALRLLLGDVNFALVPDTNQHPRLFVFRTSRQNATQLVRPAVTLPANAARQGKPVPHELVVKLKPGAKIEDLARMLGAKVIGRIDELNAYRLQFEDESSAESARDRLAANSDVEAVDNNYSIDRPEMPSLLTSSPMAPPRLQLNPPPDSGKVVVGLIDTAVQSQGSDLDKFTLKQISVAGEAQLDPTMPSHGTSMREAVLYGIEKVAGGNTAVQILPVDVYGANPTTSTFVIADGIVRAVNNGANVINLSLGSHGNDPVLSSVIEQVIGKNIPVFAAAGNEPVTTPVYPAAYPGVLAVTAVDQGQLAAYANRGSFVDLGAPGTSVVHYNNKTYYVVGTSPASAFTAGVAAGFMDQHRAGAKETQTFIQQQFGVKIIPK